MTNSAQSAKPVIHAIDEFLAFLHSDYPQISNIVIALSGGKDSVCLLSALKQQAKSHHLTAIYIDHGLQQDSAAWANFNAQLCSELGIEFISCKVTVNTQKSSLEQEARKARYEALADFVDEKCCLVTAQHQDDQVETLLLQMLRGAGVKGLAAMPFIKPFAQGYHARPLLNVSQASIETYVTQEKLNFIEDPSNQDTRFKRNYLRHQVLPVLRQEWPQANKSLSKVAENQAESNELLSEIAAEDFTKVGINNGLSISSLLELSEARQNNLLRYWFEVLGQKMPSKSFLTEIKQQLLMAEADAEPIVELDELQLRRYRNFLYAISPQNIEMDLNQEWEWRLVEDFEQVSTCKILLNEVLNLWPELTGQKVKVRYRRPGDKFYLPNKSHGQSLKNYFQEQAIPTWLRETALLVVHQDQVIFIQEKTL
ncbi:MAG: tRNA lysidine(34) synthetase TilS [Gammaproteobacteria bacterium]|nr:tRNA lysidine(34) synthetase TilS [Gammaproteobacteria bacterium]